VAPKDRAPSSVQKYPRGVEFTPEKSVLGADSPPRAGQIPCPCFVRALCGSDPRQKPRKAGFGSKHPASVPSLTFPTLIITECRDLLAQIVEKTDRIDAKTKALKGLAAEADTARRLQTMPGVGPITALAVEAFAPDMAQFKSVRDFAAWLGLVLRQHSSGGKARLGRISKAGQTDIRRLLIIGAMTRIMGRARHKVPAEIWIGRKLASKPKMLVGIALANRMARQIWAMLRKNEDYRDPTLAAA